MKPSLPKPGARACFFGALLCASTLVRADYPSAVSALGPVAYYRLGSTNSIPSEVGATNIGTLGTAFNGTYVSMASSRGENGALAGDPDTSVSIDAGAGQLIKVPNSPVYNPNGAFSVEFWAKPADAAGGKHAAVISMVNGQNAANGNDRSGWAVQKLGDQWQFVLGFDHSDGSTFYATTLSGANGSVVPGAWQHIVATYAPGTATLYINGVPVDSQTPAQPLLPNNLAPLLIGNRGYGGWNYVGEMDEVAIYTTALSSSDVKAHYTAGTTANPAPSYKSLVLAQNPPLYLRLGEPSLALPVAVNSGSWGSVANGVYESGSIPGVPGLASPAAHGFETNNLAAGLDGTNGFVQIPAQTQVVNEATFVAWVKRDGAQPNFSGIFFQRGSDATPTDVSTGLSYQTTGDSLAYTWNGTAGSYNFNPGLFIPDQTWTFVAATVSSDHAVLYVGSSKGLQAATNTFAHDPHDFSVAGLKIGWDSTSNARIMKGSVDEVALFDKALDYNQVSSLFNAALPAILSINRTPADPVYQGETVTFTSGAVGSGTPSYAWLKGGSAIPGQTSSTLTIPNVQPSDAGNYVLTAKVGGVSLTSAPVNLAIQSSVPVITQAPVSASRFLNGVAGFSVTAVGTQPITYQWVHGSTPIPNATNSSLSLPDLAATDAGDYTIVLTNPLGTSSATASLSIVDTLKFAATVVDDGPLGYWPMTESSGSTAFDAWGGRDGHLETGATPGTVGLAAPAYAGFSSTNTVYRLASGGSVTVPPIHLNKNTMTIVTWINPSIVEPDFAGIVFTRGAGTTSGLDFNTGGQIGYHWNDDSKTYNWASGLFPATNAWNFVALVVEPSQATAYLDSGTGLQSAVNTVDHVGSGWGANIKFGLDDNGGGRSFTGLIGPVAIFDRSLSQAEITALHNAGISGTYTGPVPVSISQSPVSQTVMAGDSFTVTGKATGTPPISYQWLKDNQPIPGAVRQSLTVVGAAVTNSGAYKLTASQNGTTVSTTAASIVVNPIPEYLNATNGLVLHLKFDGDYSDSSGRGNNGTPSGAPSFIPGAIGSGALQYSTDSANQVYNYVTLGTPADLAFGADVNFSVSYWIKFTGAPGDLPFLGSANNSTYNPGITFSASYKLGGWNYTLGDGTTTIGPSGANNSINDGSWHSLVHTFDRTGNGVTYLDGVIVNVTSIAGLGAGIDTGNVFNIGQDPGGSYGESAVENIDDLGIWRRALSQYEAEAIYVVGSKYGRSFDVPAPPSVTLTIQETGSSIVIGWSAGVLQSASSPKGPWTNVPGAVSPSYTVTPPAGGATVFYRASY